MDSLEIREVFSAVNQKIQSRTDPVLLYGYGQALLS